LGDGVLKKIDTAADKALDLHLGLDNYSTHKTKQVQKKQEPSVRVGSPANTSVVTVTGFWDEWNSRETGGKIQTWPMFKCEQVHCRAGKITQNCPLT
jgi:hypothetical protein